MCIVSGSALHSGRCTCPVTFYVSVEYFYGRTVAEFARAHARTHTHTWVKIVDVYWQLPENSSYIQIQMSDSNKKLKFDILYIRHIIHTAFMLAKPNITQKLIKLNMPECLKFIACHQFLIYSRNRDNVWKKNGNIQPKTYIWDQYRQCSITHEMFIDKTVLTGSITLPH
jgi:hypothetical protein